ncbi:hypothetical protein HK105_205357 [Polyrhizophydium stewartii]|uniref:Uncharacterized protein n=1 Tax=Polyrhizophydium stewartii TaxID=2732419 RepID=A0ABR4N6F7_9FUNG|nr:hypothetical protein HK105_001052 [Polyrhizophydium stewartii]
MPLKITQSALNLFFVNIFLHARWALTTYMLIKGLRWAARNNLSLILVVSLLFSFTEAGLQSAFLAQISFDCVNHLRIMYTAWIVYTFLLDFVLYYRAWCISTSKTEFQRYISIVMTLVHAASLIVDAQYSISVTFETPTIGCVSFPAWPRSLFGACSTVNDLVQVAFFCAPLLRAVKNVSGLRHDTSAYRRMIMKSAVCLVVCTLTNVTYALLVSSNYQVISLIFSDTALLFQILGACEIQFNSHRETDKASLGAIMYQSPMNRQRKIGETSVTIASTSSQKDGAYASSPSQTFSHVL